MNRPIGDPLAELLGESPAVAAVREKIRRLLSRDTSARRLPPVLIQGETGTGKGLLARIIHRAGPRANGPFVDVNCAAIPENLMEAEMFGFERGAFTDARQPKPGLFQAAHGGTIFLDEIGLLSPGLQAKVLKVIEERSVRRLGSTKSESVDVWILTATNEDLTAAVRDKQFRSDLYHRLAVLMVSLPPLRERSEDVVRLGEHFLARACADYGLAPKTLAPDAEAALSAYQWPGNVRELNNVMERVALMAEDVRVTASALSLGEDDMSKSTEPEESAKTVRLEDAIGDVEREHLLDALRQTNWNISRAAARLGISRNTIRYRIEKHGLRPDQPSPARGRRKVAPSVPASPVVREASVPTPVAILRWEPRRITLMRARVTVAESSDSPSETSRMLEAMVEKVGTFGGRVEELSSTEIIGAFGLEPVEDAPRRAANAALAILKAGERARGEDIGSPLTVKIAIHVSEMMVGRPNGKAEINQDAKRQATVVLEQLLEHIEADGIVVSAATAPFLERRFELLPVGQAPAVAHRLASPRRSAFGPGGRMAQFVGRRHELELLQSRLESVTQGQGQVIGVAGEAGIGKSRLVFEFRQNLAGQLVTYVEGHCFSYGSTIPYLPILDILGTICGIAEADTPETVADKVQACLGQIGIDAREWTPYLLYLLGIKDERSHLAELGPDVIKARIFEVLRQIFLMSGRQKPLVVVVEDLHWIDQASEEFLGALAEHVGGARVLLATTYRQGYRPPWIEKSYASQLALQPLAPQDSFNVVRSVFGAEQITEPLLDTILAKAEGNPFFLEELARAAREQGVSSPLAVPDTIEEVLLARIDHLPSEERNLLQAAAVIGNDFPLLILRAIAELPEDSLRRALTRLRAAEFFYETNAGGEVDYIFKHALTHEVAYRSLHSEDRRGLHARIVEVIERLYGGRPGEHIERLAHHAFEGALWMKAVGYLRQAGTKAASRAAHREALACFEQALAAIAQLPENRETMRHAIDLRFDLRSSLVPLLELGRAREYLNEAKALAETLGDSRRLGLVSAYMSACLWAMGDSRGAVESGEQALAIAERLGDPTLQVLTNFYLGRACYAIGDYRRSVTLLKRTVQSIADDQVRNRLGVPFLPSVLARVWLAWSLAERGEFAEAVALGGEAVEIAESVEQPYDLILAHFGLGGAYLRQGVLEMATQLLEEGLATCKQHHVPLLLAPTVFRLGYAYALAGQISRALKLIEENAPRPTSARIGGQLYDVWLGEAYFLAGRLDDAARAADRALQQSRRYQERGVEGWALRLIGEILSRRDPPDEERAQHSYRAALALGEAHGMAPLVAHCHLGLGALYSRLGARGRARSKLSVALEQFRSMGMTFWLNRAEAEWAKTDEMTDAP